MNKLLLFLLYALFCSALQPPTAAAPALPTPIVGIDHMPLVVQNVDRAAEDYRQLGFAIKPGRSHDNGIVNQHVKFPDGSGIELISAREATDELTKRYLILLAQGEGPAYLALHVRETERLRSALNAAQFSYSERQGLIELHDPKLSFLFFVCDNRSSTDRPEHFAHRNSAVAMSAVWIALDDGAGFERLLLALGAVASRERVFTPEPVIATVLKVDNGTIILLPGSSQRVAGRPIIGATFEVRDLAVMLRVLDAGKLPAMRSGTSVRPEIVVPASATHGITLSFVQHARRD